MNILFLTPYLPYPLNNGGLIRVHHLLINIARRHTVTLLCMEPDNSEQTAGIEIIRKYGINIELVPVSFGQKKKYKRILQLQSLFSKKPYEYRKYFSDSMQRKIDSCLSNDKYDLLLVEFSQMGYYRLNTSIPKYVDQHNVEYEIMQRTYETERSPVRKLLAKFEWKKYEIHEIDNCRKFDTCLTTSSRDAEILKQRLPQIAYHIIPNGVDSEFFQRGKIKINKHLILFTGTISYYPNTEGVMWFYKEIWPLIKKQKPDAQFCIAGKSPPTEVTQLAKIDENIVVTGAVDDMREYYETAAVVVVPLRVGGGTRLKILEGMSMQKAIVSTSIGAEGINHSNGNNILLSDAPGDFANSVVSVMDDEQLRKKLESGGRSLVEAQYDWRAVTERLCDIFEADVKVSD